MTPRTPGLVEEGVYPGMAGGTGRRSKSPGLNAMRVAYPPMVVDSGMTW